MVLSNLAEFVLHIYLRDRYFAGQIQPKSEKKKISGRSEIHMRYLAFIICSLLLAIVTLNTSDITIKAAELVNPDYIPENPEATLYELDIDFYAEHNNVSREEAYRRLSLQDTIGQLDAKLTEQEVETFGGLWIEHTPKFKVVIQFTSEGDSTLTKYLSAFKELEGIIEIRTNNISYANLKQARKEVVASIEKLGLKTLSDIDIKTGRITIGLTDSDRELLNHYVLERNIVLSDNVDIVNISYLGNGEADIYGGLGLKYSIYDNFCTIGFSVINSSGTRGVVTAGHAPDSLSYNNQSLTWMDEVDAAEFDCQWHTTPNYIPRRWIKISDGGTTRNIVAVNGRSTQAIGAFVTKYGVATGSTSGHIASKDRQLAFDHAYTFILVQNTYGNDLSQNHDSGAPWYHLGSAYGIHSDSDWQDSNDAIYMAADYVYGGMGVNILTISP
jgi:hypothetical protein